jgi:Cu(I)-responsive transcriptional regulator
VNISEAARASGLSAKALRYYERIGLIIPAGRRRNGYRDYDDTDVQRLRFIHRARSLGFSVQECRELLALYEDRRRTSAEVKRIALERIAAVERKIRELEAMRRALMALAERCHGDAQPDCPILDDLAGITPAVDGSAGPWLEQDDCGTDKAEPGPHDIRAVRDDALDRPQPGERRRDVDAAIGRISAPRKHHIDLG